MLFAFANEISEGDAVISSDRARRQVVVGRVAGPYEWVEDDSVNLQHHTRRIEWFARWGWDDLPETVKNTVLHDLLTGILATLLGLLVFLLAIMDFPFRGEFHVGPDAFEDAYALSEKLDR